MATPTRHNVTGSGRHLGYGALLGDNFFRLAVAPDRQVVVETAPLEAPRVNTGASAEDFSSEFGARYSRADFSGGEGLVYAQRAEPDPRDPSRYYDSRDVDITPDGRVTLLNATELLDADAGTGQYLAYVNGTVYRTDGQLLRVTSDPSSDPPTFANEDPHAAEAASTVADVAGIGTTVYAAVADGIHRKTSGGAWAHWHTRAGITRLWTAKGRLFAAVGNVLYAYDTGSVPTETTVLTIAVGQVYHDLADAGSHVLVTASDGYVYAITDDGTTLTVAAQSYLEGEVGHGIGSAFGVVVYGTATSTRQGGRVGRLYRANLDGGVLTGIQRLRLWESTTLDRTPRWVRPAGDSIYVGVSETASEVHLWRYDLANAGLHRSFTHAAGGVSRDMVMVDDVPWTSIDTSGLWRESGDLVASGHIIGPLGDLLTAQDKTWASISTTFCCATGGGERLTVEYTTASEDIDLAASASWRRLTTYTRGDTTEEAALPAVESRYIAVKYVLQSDASRSNAPMLRAYSVRAYPNSDELVVRFPVSVSDQVERPGKHRVSIRGFGETVLAALAELEGRATTLEMPHLDLQLRGVVEVVQRPVLSLSPRGSSSAFAVVTFRGERMQQQDQTGGDILFGNSFGGVGTFGHHPVFGKVAR